MNVSKIRLPAAAAALGLGACILRFCLYAFGTDEKGLLIPGHPLTVALWALTAAAAGFVLIGVRKEKGSRRYAHNFPAGNLPGFGCFAFAAGLFVTVMANRHAYETLDFIRNIVCLLAVPALAAVAVCRRQGKRPLFGFHALVCLALMLHTVSYYRSWSSRPQLVDSVFPMMGCLLLMLFAYYQTAFDVNMGSRRMQLDTGLLAAVFCFAAIPESQTQLLYLTGGIWTLTNLCSLTPTPESKEETQ